MKLETRRLAELRSDMAGAAIDAQVKDYDRVVELTVADVVRLYVRTGGGELRIDDTAPSDVDGMLRVGIAATAARGVGTGTALIEDEFASGSITLDGVQPDDYRQAPVLERLLEGMATVGLFEEAGHAVKAPITAFNAAKGPITAPSHHDHRWIRVQREAGR